MLLPHEPRGAAGSSSMYPATRSKNVQRRPCVVILRIALIPSPRYIRAIPACIGRGLAGSGPTMTDELRFHIYNGILVRKYLEQVFGRFPICHASVRQPTLWSEPSFWPWFVFDQMITSELVCPFQRFDYESTHTSRGYINAHDVTPDNDPQQNGTIEAGMGSQEGVGPCSPDGRRPIRWRIPSYSRK